MTAARVALVLSAIAAVGSVSGWLAWFSMRRQHRELLRENRELAATSDEIQDRLARVEEARRRDELRPGLSMESAVDNESRLLTIRNGDRTDLDHVEIVEAIEAPPVIARGIKSCTGAYFGLRMGEAMTVTVPTDDNKNGGRLVLKLRVKVGADAWEVPVYCEVLDSHPSVISYRMPGHPR